MAIKLSLCDKTLSQRKNPKNVVKNNFTANSLWIACFICVLASLPSVSPFHLSLRGGEEANVNMNILVKGKGAVDISIDIDSRDSTFDQSDKKELLCKLVDSTAQTEAIGVNADPQIEQIKTKAETTEKIDPKKLIREAILEDDENETKKLITQFYDNLNGDEDFRPLSVAAERCKPKVAEMLIKNGADLNAISGGEWRPIHVATFADCSEIVNMLIENGADLSAKIGLGFTALDIALQDRHEEISKLLIRSLIFRTQDEDSSESTSEDSSDTSEYDWYSSDDYIYSEQDSPESTSQDNSNTSEQDSSRDQSEENSSNDQSQYKTEMGDKLDESSTAFFYKRWREVYRMSLRDQSQEESRGGSHQTSGDESDIDVHYFSMSKEDSGESSDFEHMPFFQ